MKYTNKDIIDIGRLRGQGKSRDEAEEIIRLAKQIQHAAHESAESAMIKESREHERA